MVGIDLYRSGGNLADMDLDIKLILGCWLEDLDTKGYWKEDLQYKLVYT